MLETTVELLSGLLLMGLVLLISCCIVGSIVVALVAVSRPSTTSTHPLVSVDALGAPAVKQSFDLGE